MTSRARIISGLLAAVVAAMALPSLTAVAWHSGSGNRSISGHVKGVRGNNLGYVCATAYSATDRFDQAREYASEIPLPPTGYTNTEGRYVIERLLPGDYKIRFGGCAGPPQRIGQTDLHYRQPGETYFGRPVPQWYPAEATWETAAVVTVPADSDVTGIDTVMVGP